MFKMPHTGKDHSDTVFVTQVDRFLITDRASRLDNRPDTGPVSRLYTITEGEESIGCQHSSLGGCFADQLGRMLEALLCCPDPIYLSRPDADGLFILRYGNTV